MTFPAAPRESPPSSVNWFFSFQLYICVKPQNITNFLFISFQDLPYIENLPHQLDVGRAIVVEGSVLPDAIG